MQEIRYLDKLVDDLAKKKTSSTVYERFLHA
ncbi:DUF2200 family protein [Parabacteroides distasonis]|nr:DUF2200 family protein [Parabacteroides distasonis]